METKDKMREALERKAQTIYYLKSIYGHLKEFKSVLPDETAFSLGGEAFSDNMDWLDCHIDQLEREALSSPPPPKIGEDEIRQAAKEGNKAYWHGAGLQEAAFKQWQAAGCPGDCPQVSDGSQIDHITRAILALINKHHVQNK